MRRVLARSGSILLAFGLLLGSAGFAQAQRERRTESLIPPPQLLARLKLTPEQGVKLKAAIGTLEAEMQKAGALTNREERGQASAKANEAYREAVRSTLTPEQLQEIQPLLQEAARLGPQGLQVLSLDLSDEQKAKIKSIGDRYQPEFEKLRTEAAGNREALREKFTDLETRRSKELREVLTPEQQLKINERNGRRGGISGPIPIEWLPQLNLAADQKAMIDAAVAIYRAEMAKLEGLGREERGEPARRAFEAYAATVREVLTPQQQERVRTMLEEAGKLGGIGIRVYSLSLSDEQQAKLKEIAARHQPEAQKLRESAAQTANPREALRPQYEALQEKINSDVLAVLTAEQLKQLEDRGSRRRE